MPKVQILSGDNNCWYKEYVGTVVEVNEYFASEKMLGKMCYSLLFTNWNRKNLSEEDFNHLRKYGLIIVDSDADLIEGRMSHSKNMMHSIISPPNAECNLTLPFDDVGVTGTIGVEKEESLSSVNAKLDQLENQSHVDIINKLIEARKSMESILNMGDVSSHHSKAVDYAIKDSIKKQLEALGIKGLDIL